MASSVENRENYQHIIQQQGHTREQKNWSPLSYEEEEEGSEDGRADKLWGAGIGRGIDGQLWFSCKTQVTHHALDPSLLTLILLLHTILPLHCFW